jgi:sugar-phosphatase
MDNGQWRTNGSVSTGSIVHSQYSILHCGAVLFDLDGVLVDSTACIERHWRRWAERHRLDPAEVLRVAHGRRTVETIGLVAPHLSVEDEAGTLEEGAATDLDGVRVVPGARELLDALPPHAWAIVTSGTLPVARGRLTHAGLPVPRVLVSADSVKRGKPHPEGYLAAAAEMGIPPGDGVVVEDSPPGVDAGHAAGLRVIGVLSTHTSEELARADVQVRRLGEIHYTPRGAADGIDLDLDPRGPPVSPPESEERR